MPLETETLDADVVIIGAGAAGLAAAIDLAAGGVSVCVVEGRDRAGGRVHTLHPADLDYPVELGAEFVHGRAPSVFRFVNEAGVMLADVTDSHWFQDGSGLVKAGEFWEDVEKILGRMDEMPQDMSFSNFLQQEFSGAQWEKARAVVLSYVQGFNAADAEKIGIKGLAVQEQAEEKLGETQFRVISGYDSVIQSMLSKLARVNFRYRTIAKEVHWNDPEAAKVSVIDIVEKRAYELRSKRILVTIPLGVLKSKQDAQAHLRFVPPLAEKANALALLEMGPVARNTYRFSSRFWESLKLQGWGEEADLMQMGFLHNDDLPIPTWWTQLPVRTPLLVGWVAGRKFEEKLSEAAGDEIAEAGLDSLAAMLKVNRGRLEELLVESYTHKWQDDPFAFGAYSYVRPEGLAAQKLLAQPVSNRLFFAGEATNTEGNWGTVHGAMDSGTRAAAEVIGSLDG
jgi:monoamine oxidase